MPCRAQCTGSSLLPLDVWIDFLSPCAASNLGLPACKTCCPGSSHVYLESCTSDVSITHEHKPSRPGPRKEACHDHRMPHPKVFGPRMARTKCTFSDMQTSHRGAADHKALSLVARRSMEADVARNTSKELPGHPKRPLQSSHRCLSKAWTSMPLRLMPVRLVGLKNACCSAAKWSCPMLSPSDSSDL